MQNPDFLIRGKEYWSRLLWLLSSRIILIQAVPLAKNSKQCRLFFFFRKRVTFNVSNMCLDKARSSVFCKADKVTKFEKYRKENFSKSLVNQLGLFFFSFKWCYDQKVTLPGPCLLYFESMYYRYLPCLILSHDFDEKFDFLNYESSKRLPSITQFKNGRERMWRHPIKQRNNLFYITLSPEFASGILTTRPRCLLIRLLINHTFEM